MTPQLQTKLLPTQQPEKVLYPDSDGQPMSDNTLQFGWIVKLKEGCEALFKDNPNVFVAGDLLWYPIEGDNKTRRAPDVMVVFGRPKGYRGSYQQWLEDNIAPQVVFEILSSNNYHKNSSFEQLLRNSYHILITQPRRYIPYKISHQNNTAVMANAREPLSAPAHGTNQFS